MWTRIGVGGLVVFLLGCPEKTLVEVVDSGEAVVAVDAGSVADSGALTIDAGPTTLEPEVSAEFVDGGVAVVTANSEIERARRLTVKLPVALKDFRIRLLDWRDQIVVSDDQLSDDGRLLTVAPTEPLKSGRSYSLVLDAELGPVVTAESGATFNDWELSFRISGEVEPEPQPPGSVKKKPSKKKK